ncbi:MAG: large subunit ribosomal protein L25 [Lentimonas sp.]|jgi:large subunit ribosomal protein L25
MQQFKLNIVTREATGRGPARRLRAEGLIPASIYGQGKARSITVNAVDFRGLNRQIGRGAALVELTDEKGVTALSLIQEIQRDAIRDNVKHIDFQEVERGHSFVTSVPVHLIGEAEAIGVKFEGGVIDHKTHELEIRCRPSKLPNGINVDVKGLAVGAAIHISDLPVLEGVEYLGEPLQVVVSCQAPTVAVAVDATDAVVSASEVPSSRVKSDSERDAASK